MAERGRLVQALPRGDMLALPLCEADARALLTPDLDIAALGVQILSSRFNAVPVYDQDGNQTGTKKHKGLTWDSHVFEEHDE